MKVYNIYDEDLQSLVGVLFYYEREQSYNIELNDNLDEWTAPLLFTAYVKKRIYSIPRDVSKKWIQSRLIPSNRQNINDILKNHKLKTYDEIKFLEISLGKCSQDSIFIKRTDIVPEFAEKRAGIHIKECFISSDESLICFFEDDTVRKVPFTDLANIKGIDKVMKNEALKYSCKPTAGGHAITFNDSIDVPCRVLHSSGLLIPLTPADFYAFVVNSTLDTAETCNTLNCSRQNLSYLVKDQKIKPIRQLSNNALYSKGEIYTADN